jgi:2-oxoglutarate ferredoxin oxidoreductase subunit alpha
MGTATNDGITTDDGILGNSERKDVQEVDDVTILFAGDSGDGMQITGSQFSDTSVVFGNDISTFPDFPAEIRAPVGTLEGVSAFQLHFSNHDIRTPGDKLDVLVAMNAAALKKYVGELKHGGTLIVDKAGFGPNELKKVNYASNPLEDGSLAAYRLVPIDITPQAIASVKPAGISGRAAERCKNFYTLGVLYWLYDRPVEPTIEEIKKKYGKKDPAVAEANVMAIRAGYNFANTIELFTSSFRVRKAKFDPGLYRNISGNVAAALGITAAASKSGRKVFFGSYPITPASDILHELSKLKHFGVLTFQAEDEIAAVASAIGASYAGELGVTCSSGPGIALKSEAINLALMVELPLLVVDVQRAGPSTGMPTKTEQADLLQVLWGRNGDSPIPVLAAATPGDCFETIYECARIAVKYMTPVMFLSDGYLGNGAEPWKVPDLNALKPFEFGFGLEKETFKPYLRNPETGARPWAVPGTPGLEHRLTGIEKEAVTGKINYEPENHQKMTNERHQKVANIAKEIGPSKVSGDQEGELLVISWGGTFGAVLTAVEEALKVKRGIGHLHLRYLNPLPADLKDIMAKYKTVAVPELNNGQLAYHLQGTYGRPVASIAQASGRMFSVSGLVTKFLSFVK